MLEDSYLGTLASSLSSFLRCGLAPANTNRCALNVIPPSQANVTSENSFPPRRDELNDDNSTFWSGQRRFSLLPPPPPLPLDLLRPGGGIAPTEKIM